MRVSWKRSLAILNQLGMLGDISDTCYLCNDPLRYDQDVDVLQLEDLSDGGLVHHNCIILMAMPVNAVAN